jgi:hypothetical protein
LEEHIAYIFGVEEIGSAKPASKQAAQQTTRRHIPEDYTLKLQFYLPIIHALLQDKEEPAYH